MTNDVLNYEILDTVGTLSAGTQSSTSLNVTASFWSDWQAGKELQLFQLSHRDADGDASGSNSGAYAYFPCNGFSLELTYPMP